MNVDSVTRRRSLVDLAFVAGGLASAALLASFWLQPARPPAGAPPPAPAVTRTARPLPGDVADPVPPRPAASPTAQPVDIVTPLTPCPPVPVRPYTGEEQPPRMTTPGRMRVIPPCGNGPRPQRKPAQ